MGERRKIEPPVATAGTLQAAAEGAGMRILGPPPWGA